MRRGEVLVKPPSLLLYAIIEEWCKTDDILSVFVKTDIMLGLDYEA